MGLLLEERRAAARSPTRGQRHDPRRSRRRGRASRPRGSGCAGSARPGPAPASRRASASGLGADAGGRRAVPAGRDVAGPEEAEDERERRADRGDRPADHQADEQADDADGEADRPQARRRKLRSIVPRALFQAVSPLTRSGWIQSLQVWPRQRRNSWRNAPSRRAVRAAGSPRPYSSQRSSTRRRTSSLISISVRPRPRAFLRALVRRVDPELAAVELQRRRVVEMVERALADQHVALRVDVGADAEEDLLVVVHVDPLVHDHDRLGQAEQPEAPDRVHHLLRVAGDSSCGSRRCSSCGRRPRPAGRSRRSRARSSGSPAGRSARSPCRATRPPAAACRRRSTGRSRRAASSSR